MKLLLAGCRQRFTTFQYALDCNAYELKQFRDSGQLFQGRRLVDADYDWVILDGRLFKGEREFARFFGRWSEKTPDTFLSGGCNCEDEMLEERAWSLCHMTHRTKSQSANSPGFSRYRDFGEGGQMFGYHAPCRAKR